MLDDRIANSLQKAYQEALSRGELLAREELGRCYALFRERFGPERLQALDLVSSDASSRSCR